MKKPVSWPKESWPEPSHHKRCKSPTHCCRACGNTRSGPPAGARTFSAGGVPGEKSDEPNSEERRFRTKEPTWRPVDVEGGVIGADCSGKPEVMITVGQEKGPLHLYAEKYKSVQMT